jgi:hypothetical protein
MICLDECQATRARVYALFDDTNVLHTFYQYLTRHCHRSCFDDVLVGHSYGGAVITATTAIINGQPVPLAGDFPSSCFDYGCSVQRKARRRTTAAMEEPHTCRPDHCRNGSG